MLRILFSFLLLIHGLIHLLGFVQAFQLATIEGMRLKSWATLLAESPRLSGTLWFAAFLLFLGAALLFVLKKESWWILTLAAVIFSQVLILLYWQEAKFGTIANSIILAGVLLGYAAENFNQMVRMEQTSFTSERKYPAQVITREMIAGLPAPVQRWLSRSGSIGKPVIHTVYLEQKGRMRTTPTGKWMEVEAREYFTVPQPGFLWIADVKAAPFINLAGRDKYENGRGHMLIKALSLVTVANAQGKETDQGTLLRFLGEIVWLPSTAIRSYITWEAIDDRSAKATMTYGGVSASGIFRFTAEGDPESFEAQRYYNQPDGHTLETWLVTIDQNSFKEFEGIRIPAMSAVTWKLNSGDFTWFELEITHVNYNRHVKFSPAVQPEPSMVAK